MISRLLTLSLATLVILGTSQARADQAEKDLKQMQGTWTGKETGREDAGTCKLKVEGNKMEFEGWHEKEWYKGTFQIVTENKHNEIHSTVDECPIPEFIDKLAKSIYKLEGGKLTIAGRRPGSDSTPNGFDDPKARHFIFEKDD